MSNTVSNTELNGNEEVKNVILINGKPIDEYTTEELNVILAELVEDLTDEKVTGWTKFKGFIKDKKDKTFGFVNKHKLAVGLTLSALIAAGATVVVLNQDGEEVDMDEDIILDVPEKDVETVDENDDAE